MYGFTGTWHGQPVSVQGSGMGQPSMSIYVNELFKDYDVQRVIRVGSCGAAHRGGGPARRRDRLRRVHRLVDEPAALPRPRLRAGGRLRAAPCRRTTPADARDDVTSHVGLIFSGDTFYNPRQELMEPMVAHGVLAVEMEASRALHARGVVRPQGAGDLHRQRPRRHRRGDDVARSGSRPSARWSTSPSGGCRCRLNAVSRAGPAVATNSVLCEGTCGPALATGSRHGVTASWRTTHRSPLLSRIATP